MVKTGMEVEQSAGYPASVANLDDYFAWTIYFPVNTALLPYSVGFSVVSINKLMFDLTHQRFQCLNY